MNESAGIVLYLVVGYVVGYLWASYRGRASRPAASAPILERKVDLLLEHAGIDYDPLAGFPEAAREALARGKYIDAIKEYRAATGVGLEEARAAVDEAKGRIPGR